MNRAFKNIRNRIGRQNGEDLVRQLVDLLNNSEASSSERQTRYPMWHLLLLLKWAFMYGDFSNLRRLDPVRLDVVHALLDRLWTLSGQVIGFNTALSPHLSIRKISQQQFWTMRRESIPYGFARQYHLFGGLASNHSFRQSFLHVTGVNMDDFFDLSFDLFLKTMTGVTVDNAKTVSDTLFQTSGKGLCTRFMDSLAKPADKVSSWLQDFEKAKDEKFRSVKFEYFQDSPFFLYPLMKLEQSYVVLSHVLLHSSLSTFIYDVLRADDREGFTAKFGKTVFEEYLRQSFASVGLTFLTESDLETHFKGRSYQQLIDFIVVENDCNIFVEAKGVAMRWEGLVDERPGTIRNHTKSSIRAAIKQAFDVSYQLRDTVKVKGIEIGSKANYLLVVTFKDFYLGNGQQFRDHVAKKELDALIDKYGGQAPIPLENIFFVSIDELDIVLGAIAHGSFALSELMRMAVQQGIVLGGYPVFRSLVLGRDGKISKSLLMENAEHQLFQRLEKRYQ